MGANVCHEWRVVHTEYEWFSFFLEDSEVTSCFSRPRTLTAMFEPSINTYDVEKVVSKSLPKLFPSFPRGHEGFLSVALSEHYCTLFSPSATSSGCKCRPSAVCRCSLRPSCIPPQTCERLAAQTGDPGCG